MQNPTYKSVVLALVAMACVVMVPDVYAAEPPPRALVSHIAELFERHYLSENLMGAATKLFWGLATISLVWTMGMLILRQDIGEVIMELLRFMVVTGIFYWLLINVSDFDGDNGFVRMIIGTFLQLPNDEVGSRTYRGNADDIVAQGIIIYIQTVKDLTGGEDPDKILGVGIATLILIVLACLGAQFLLMLVMAWVLGYAGIFLLGFGGARWTSPIAVSYYKHVVAVGIAMLVLTIIGVIGQGLLHALTPETGHGIRAVSAYDQLGMALAISVLMLVLGLKVPQLMFTLVTRSPLGFYAGTAAAAGNAFASGGSAIAAGFQRPVDGSGPGGASNAVMSAASVGVPGGDAFHVDAGADPFGVPRRADPLRHGTAFGRATTTATPIGDMEVNHGRPEAADAPERHSEAGTRQRPDYDAEISAAASARGDRRRTPDAPSVPDEGANTFAADESFESPSASASGTQAQAPAPARDMASALASDVDVASGFEGATDPLHERKRAAHHDGMSTIDQSVDGVAETSVIDAAHSGVDSVRSVAAIHHSETSHIDQIERGAVDFPETIANVHEKNDVVADGHPGAHVPGHSEVDTARGGAVTRETANAAVGHVDQAPIDVSSHVVTPHDGNPIMPNSQASAHVIESTMSAMASPVDVAMSADERKSVPDHDGVSPIERGIDEAARTVVTDPGHAEVDAVRGNTDIHGSTTTTVESADHVPVDVAASSNERSPGFHHDVVSRVDQGIDDAARSSVAEPDYPETDTVRRDSVIRDSATTTTTTTTTTTVKSVDQVLVDGPSHAASEHDENATLADDKEGERVLTSTATEMASPDDVVVPPDERTSVLHRDDVLLKRKDDPIADEPT